MKGILTLTLILFSRMISFSQSPASADEIMKEAYSVAKKENKEILLIFHASWCGWCHKMDTSLNDPSVKKYFDDNFVIRHMVVFESKGKESLENPGALDMLKKYNGATDGIPFWIIFDKDGNFLVSSLIREVINGKEQRKNTGCPATKEEVDYFITVLKQATTLKEDELEKIRVRFRKNEE